MIRVPEFSNWLIAIFIALLFAASPGSLFAQNLTNDQVIQRKLNTLSIDDKIGQLLMLGFYGTRLDQGLAQTLNAYRPGFLVTFSRNISSGYQIAQLNYQAQLKALSFNRIPLLIAVDQEGGAVTRIKAHRPQPSAWALGSTKDPKLAELAGAGTGKLLRTLGFNMNLAPVVDVGASRHKTFLGTRTFSSHASIVAQMATAYGSGLVSELVLPTAKHFPGHGHVVLDSHVALPIKDLSLSQLMTSDLIPFKSWVSAHENSAIMVAHMALPQIDRSGTPATYSRPIISGLLREQLGFTGLIISDDLNMEGAAQGGNLGERALRAIDAGVDVLMIAWNRKAQAQIFKALKEAVRTGHLTHERLNQSVSRILKAKIMYAEHSITRPHVEHIKSALQSPELTQVAERLATHLKRQVRLDRSATLVVVTSNQRFAQAFAHSQNVEHVYYGHPQSVNIQKIGSFILGGPNRYIVAPLENGDALRFVQTLSPQLKKHTIILGAENNINLADFHPQSREWIEPGERLPAEAP